ncbi:MAG TPA: LysR family transcriptional regulator, partial [Streptosporangiaceae bacterium]|nr:LysR family transcriptional regulator [Streptosporangiaceae bacterium]
MIDMQRARALHAVATHGSVTAAAAALHVTSSALSQQLAKLEREIGQPLLRHRGRGVVLTDAGDLLAERTEAI